jgi:geranylgeranylglycerol-phosphate geranylgeranyltransferase
MRLSWTPSSVALVRPGNLLLAAGGVAVGGFLALGRAAFPAALLWAMGSAVGLGAAGTAANDVFDLEADRVNRPLRPLVTGALSRRAAVVVAGVAGGLGLWAAWWVSPGLFVIALAALAVMIAYSPVFKARGLPGNVAVAVVASLPLVYGAVAVGDWRAGLVPFVLAALLHLARELVKDLGDVPGDLAIERRTVPIAWGMKAGFLAAAGVVALFLPVALVPWVAGWYGWRYGVVVMVLDLALVFLVVRLAQGRPGGARGALKAAMLVGLVALLWDRL